MLENLPVVFILIIAIVGIISAILTASIPFMIYMHRRDMRKLLKQNAELIDAIRASQGLSPRGKNGKG